MALPPDFHDDPVQYTRALLLDALFPATDDAAKQQLRDNVYPIASKLVEIIRSDREKIDAFLKKLDAKEDVSQALSELREIAAGTAHPPDCVCEQCLPMG